jgi:hypothetical protein
MTTSQIVKSNNKALEQRLLISIKKLSNHQKNSITVYDKAFDEPIKLNSYKVEQLINKN